jgi:hypothetical protein
MYKMCKALSMLLDNPCMYLIVFQRFDKSLKLLTFRHTLSD